MIQYGRQNITQEDIDAVVEVLQSDFLTQGPKVPLFEEVVAAKVGAKHALAVNSATSALHIACKALGLGPGDWLWTTPISFVASANCGLYCGAQVDFVDIDPLTYNLCPKALESKLIQAEREGKLPKVLVAVHLCGQSCDMEAIHSLSKRYHFKIIEDASHAIGGKYQGKYIGNGYYSDITVFSFHPVKIVTTAEGGMALTNNDLLAKKMRLLRSQGITRDPDLMTHEADGPWYYQQIDLGYNYRMTELQASLGVSQMTRLDSFVSLRNELASRYDELFSTLPIKTPWINQDCYSSFHLYVIRIDTKNLKKKAELFSSLIKKGIGVNVHYIPIHTQPYYRNMGFETGAFPESEHYYSEAISIPIHPGISERDQEYIVKEIGNEIAKL